MKAKQPSNRTLYPWNLERIRKQLGIENLTRILQICGEPDFRKGVQKRWANPPPDISAMFGLFGEVKELTIEKANEGTGIPWFIGTRQNCDAIVKELFREWFRIPMGREAERLRVIIQTHTFSLTNGSPNTSADVSSGVSAEARKRKGVRQGRGSGANQDPEGSRAE